MGKCKAITASGSLQGILFSGLVLLAGLAALTGHPAFAQDAPPTCAPAIARVVSLQGNVELQRAGATAWIKVSRLDTGLCAGDRLRTDPLSRAALFVQPETLVRVDQNTAISIGQTADEILVEFHIDEIAQTARNSQSCGAGYFITRFPRKFKVSTPHMNAAVEGTEFMVESSCKATKLTVLEGQVQSQSMVTKDTRLVAARETVESGPSIGTVFSTVISPADAVQWVLRYPPISDSNIKPEIQAAESCEGLPAVSSPTCLAKRAEMLLRLGRVDESLQSIAQVLARDPAHSDAHALRAVILVTKNERVAALESANLALSGDPDNGRAWLAMSYVQQATFGLESALESARRAQSIQSDSSLFHARVAELLLSLGNAREAETSARAAIASNSGESHAHSVLGFVRLAQVMTEGARSAFLNAIELDSFAALPRLGLGLSLIQEGKLTAGREQLEIAVALNPENSLIRSYVGKAYYEENTFERDKLAATQFALAANLDALDPTPHLYEAIRLQTGNRPVQALQAVRQSVALNGNRAVFRSRFKLDEDLAVRSASQGRIYNDLGFEDLAILDGWRSINAEPGNFSGHRLLADTFSSLPRHEIARVNELFTSQVLQPRNLTPVPPQLGETNLFILDSAGPADIAFNEFNPVFASDRWALHASANVAGNETWGNDVAIAAIQGRWSLNFGQFHFETEGFRPNNDLEQDTYSAFVQLQHSEDTSFMTELRVTSREQGDLRLLFDPDSFDPTIRQQEDSESIRFGVRHAFNARSVILGSLVHQNVDFEAVIPAIFEDQGDVDGLTGEIQHIYRGEQWRLISGLRHAHRDQTNRQDLFGEITDQDFDFDGTSAYAYSYWEPFESVTAIGGLSADFVEGRAVDTDQVNPKLGLTWEPVAGTLLRLAAMRTIQPDSFSRQDIPPRLEPTQVAGFNQVYSGSQGESEWRYGLGVDHEFTPNLFVGAEVSKRDLDVPILIVGTPDLILESDATEYSGRAYAFWTPLPTIALSAAYQYDKRENEGDLVFFEGFNELRTHRLPLSVKFFHATGISAGLSATYVDQKGEFVELLPDPPFVQFATGADRFWVVDASIGYRLPRRMGIVTVNVDNLTDENFRFQDVDPENPDIIPERFVSVRFTVAF